MKILSQNAIQWCSVKCLIATLFLILCSPAMAAEATSELSWSAPTERVDGTPLAPAEIKEYRVFYAVDANVTPNSQVITIGPDAVSESITIQLTPRAEPYTVGFSIATVDTADRMSALSDVVSKVFQVESTAKPTPPTSLTFTVSCIDGCTVTEIVVDQPAPVQ